MGQPGNGHSTGGMSPFSSPQAARDAPDSRTPVAAYDPRQLFDSHLAFVWRNLRRLGVPDSQVEDAAQDVFLVVHRRWNSFSPALSTVETWLFGIVLRVARNYRRSQQRRLAWILPNSGRDSLRETPALTDGPAEILAQREAVAVFERALAHLDEAKRTVFLLVDVEQLAVPQAATALGINLNTAYWRLRKARLAFRRALERVRAKEANPDWGGRR
jgi:RNA polymerase sigma-70 factor (ECF subfamily)